MIQKQKNESGENLAHDPWIVGRSDEALIQALVRHGQLVGVQTEQTQHGGLQIVHKDFVVDDIVTELIGRAVMYAGLHAPTSKPNGERVRMVVPA